MEELLEEFVDWARDCGEDVFYIFDNTDEAIKKFLSIRNQNKQSGGGIGSQW